MGEERITDDASWAMALLRVKVMQVGGSRRGAYTSQGDCELISTLEREPNVREKRGMKNDDDVERSSGEDWVLEAKL